jgi:hypothetical protein
MSPKEVLRICISICFYWCPGPELNRHGTMCRGILSPLRLPVPPPGRQWRIEPDNKCADGHQVPYTGLDCKQKWPAATECCKVKGLQSVCLKGSRDQFEGIQHTVAPTGRAQQHRPAAGFDLPEGIEKIAGPVTADTR